MRSRMLLAMAAVAVVAMIAPHGNAAAPLCGGTAPRETECSIEGFTITTDRPSLVVTTGLFVGAVNAEMTSETGKAKITCRYTVDPLYENYIRSSCLTSSLGTIYKDQTVNIVAKASGNPGMVPAVGSWKVLYSAS